MFVHIINMSEYTLVTQTYRQFLRSYSYVIACHLMNTEMFMTETLKSKSCHINQN